MWVNIYEHEFDMEAVVHGSQEQAFECLERTLQDGRYEYRETIAKTPQGWVSVDLSTDLDDWRRERDAELAAEERHNQSLRYPGV